MSRTRSRLKSSTQILLFELCTTTSPEVDREVVNKADGRKNESDFHAISSLRLVQERSSTKQDTVARLSEYRLEAGNILADLTARGQLSPNVQMRPVRNVSKPATR